MNDDLNDDLPGDLDDDLEMDIERLDMDDDTTAGADDDIPDMAENFGLDAEPGTKGVKAFGAGLSGDVHGNTTRGSNDPDTYRDAPASGAKTGGGGL